MKLNIFEGGRRIAMLFGGLFAAGCIAYGVFSEPSYSINFRIFSLGEVRLMLEQCSSDDATEYETIVTPEGESFHLRFCFVAQKSDEGKMGIAYAPAEEGRVWLDSKYSSNVTEYTKRFAASFKLDNEEIPAARAAKRSAYLEHWKEVCLTLVGGLAFLWAFTAGFGWILRGFLGIPRGKDARTPAA